MRGHYFTYIQTNAPSRKRNKADNIFLCMHLCIKRYCTGLDGSENTRNSRVAITPRQ